MAIPDGAAVAEKSLWQAARVTTVLTANQFQSSRLAEYGDEYFNAWTVYVLRDIRSTPGAVAAPQGEQEIITAFTSQGGTVTHPAFTVPMIAGDEILMIHPNIGAGIGAAIIAVLVALAALQADVGDASASALGSLYGILGNPAIDLATSIAAIRARTDNLAGVAPGVGATIANWFTAGETNIVLIGADNIRNKLHSLMLDITGAVSTITIRLYSQINGNERRVYQQAFTVAVDGPGLWIVNGTIGIHEVLRVTAQASAGGDDGRSIGYDYMLEAM